MTGWVVPPRSWIVAALVVAAGVTAIVVPAPSSAAPLPDLPSGAAASDQRAVNLLRAAYDAGRSLHYRGTAFVGVGDTYVRVTLEHVPGRGTVVAPAGGGRTEPARALLQPDGSAQTADSDPLAVLARHYQLVLAGTAVVAGRQALIVAALRADGTVAARFSVDKRSGLVLARSAYDQTGDQYEQIVFTDIAVDGSRAGGDTQPRQSSQLVQQPPAAASVLSGSAGAASPVGELDRLRAVGWHVDTGLDGGFQLYDARVLTAGGRPVLHLSYSDGLCSMSVFEERGVLGGRALAGWQRAPVGGHEVYVAGSVPQRLAWQGGDIVYAVLTDAAPGRVATAVAGLPYGDPGQGLLDRMRRGLDRLGSWADPFH